MPLRDPAGERTQTLQHFPIEPVPAPVHRALQRTVEVGLEPAAPAGVEVGPDAPEGRGFEFAVEAGVEGVERFGAGTSVVGRATGHGGGTGEASVAFPAGFGCPSAIGRAWGRT